MSQQYLSPKEPSTLARIDTGIRSAISFLENQRSSGYEEATHYMIFPKIAGFIGPKDKHEGCVFQRALICDTLLQAAAGGFQIDRKGIKDDIDTLIAMKCQEVRGGWKYFPSLPELPPDADDLAQIIQVLVRNEQDNTPGLCDDAISLLFEQNSYQDGSFETWIIDNMDSNVFQQIIYRAIKTKWGKGPDVEVMANLLYALYLYDINRFKTEIQRGIEFIITKQQKGGYWLSTWYCGKFYGTFVCIRILATIYPHHYLLQRAAKFLKESQNDDGGWGFPHSNPTDTALGLLTMTIINPSNRCDSEIILRALNLLLKHQSTDGHWQGTKFIQMDTTRAFTFWRRIITLLGKRKLSLLTYKSDTVTSAICLQALCAARPSFQTGFPGSRCGYCSKQQDHI